MNAIGLDLGHSAVKISATDHKGEALRITFPSVVSTAIPLSGDIERTLAAEETITVGTRGYFFGDTARLQGGSSVISGLSENWITTPEHTVLLLGALRKLAAAGIDVVKPLLVLGLPTNLFRRQRDQLKALVTHHLPDAEVFVIPQGIAPYHAVMLAPHGGPAPDRHIARESWGVIEVGHFTTDFMLVKEGRWIEHGSGVCSGARVAAEHLVRLLGSRGITTTWQDGEMALHEGQLRHFGEVLKVPAERDQALRIIVGEVIDTATRLIESEASNLHGVIVAGGGANLVINALREKWPHVVMVDEPRFAVSEGMRRYGDGIQRARAMMSAA